MRYLALIGAVAVLTSGCEALEQIRLGSSTFSYDPNKIYLKSESFTVRRNADLDRFVCLTGILQCEGRGLDWECECP